MLFWRSLGALLLAMAVAAAVVVHDIVADMYAGFEAIWWLLRYGELPQPRLTVPSRPPLETPAARYPRAGLDPADPANAHLLGICPVCGWEDPSLVLEDATWGGWPAHWACAEWMGPDKPAALLAEASMAASVSIGSAASLSGAGSITASVALHVAERAEPIAWTAASVIGEALIEGVPVSPGIVVPGGGMSVIMVDKAGNERMAALPASDATNPRIDLIFLSGGYAGHVTGTPRPDPDPPCLPAGAQQCALVYILPGSTTIAPCNLWVPGTSWRWDG